MPIFKPEGRLTSVRRRVAFLSLAIFCLAGIGAPQAAAHTALEGMGGFWSGVGHLLLAPERIALIIGLVIWVRFHDARLNARLSARLSARIVAAVLTGSALGGCATFISGTIITSPTVAPGVIAPGVNAPGLPWPVAAGMIGVGVAGAAQVVVSPGILVMVVTGMAILLGAGADAPADGDWQTMGLVMLGWSLAVAAVLSYGLIITTRLTAAWTLIALRAGASWIAAIGLMILALASARYFGLHR